MTYVRNIGQKLTIFDEVDNWVEHSAYSKIKDRLRENYKTVKSDADIIFTVSEDLQSLFIPKIGLGCYTALQSYLLEENSALKALIAQSRNAQVFTGTQLSLPVMVNWQKRSPSKLLSL